IHPEVKTKPLRTQFEMLLCNMALTKNIPILGICGGAQIINVCLGGTLIQHIPDEIPNALNHQTGALSSHSIKIEKESMLSKIFNKSELIVNSSHHQSINVSGKDLIISAIAEDNVVEAIELKNHPFCIGVQWHPEFLLTPEDNLLFKAFMNAI
ncbi:MAG: gamma-glutamyl-gamma-aminobutyrate hydrolase family protein, partial [Alphaproteobacteria bacterium]|nr:gamma-glutamyl-gamma-aminobutyrate hydrolase family protein [Alphaproteobacteria bacterium]